MMYNDYVIYCRAGLARRVGRSPAYETQESVA